MTVNPNRPTTNYETHPQNGHADPRGNISNQQQQPILHQPFPPVSQVYFWKSNFFSNFLRLPLNWFDPLWWCFKLLALEL